MNQDSLWITIPTKDQNHFANTSQILNVIINNQHHLVQVSEGRLIIIQDGVPLSYIIISQWELVVNEECIQLFRGQMRINLNSSEILEVLDEHCMHTTFTEDYVVEGLIDSEVQILKIRDRHSTKLMSARQLPNNSSIDHAIRVLQPRIYRDQFNWYLVTQSLYGSSPKSLNFIELYFALLKLVHKYQLKQLYITNLNIENITLLDDYYNLELFDISTISTSEYQGNAIQEFINLHYPEETLFAGSIQEQLYNEVFLNYFGESQFYMYLNKQPNHIQQSSQGVLETFTSIQQSLLDSDSDGLSDDSYIKLLRSQRMQSTESMQQILSPVIKHAHSKSSRQFVLETLLSENIINQQQYQNLYREEDFQNRSEFLEFSELLQKEIDTSCTPINSQNTTCPNTIKTKINRVTDLIVEVEEEWVQKKQPYNASKVQNVRKNLFSLH